MRYLAIILLVASAAAQTKDPRNQVSLWFSDSVGSNGAFSSSARGTEKQFELRYGRYLYDEYGVTAHYVASFVPYSYITWQNGAKAAGVGFLPLGAEVEFSHLYVRPMLTASGGFVYYQRPIFGSDKAFNFVAQFGGGLRFLSTDDFTVDADYLFHHISNWNTGTTNPGMSNSSLSIGVTRRW